MVYYWQDEIERVASTMDNEMLLEAIGKMMDQRFEDFGKSIDQRFEDFGKSIDQRFEAFRKEMDETLDERFVAFHRAVSSEIAEVYKKMDRRFDEQERNFTTEIERQLAEGFGRHHKAIMHDAAVLIDREFYGQFATLADGQKDILHRLDRLEEQVDDFKFLRDMLDVMRTAVIRHNDQISKQNSRILEFSELLDELLKRIEGHDSELEELRAAN